ncbi:hypothetical protein EXT68_02930 [Pectobacterium parmentieri]|nr:hypothetical protein [Pectobacterium parmentieri]MBI0472097.1 hypothetical protein [Pectobacterium parmentieri]MBI0495870.1 hypothetical protein [Pectobacterium parmentieri]MBI0556258.1 hypothetical protein [Pectobacterium parmentieri]MBI0569342.1 hypothetical protein [Pectobacterium parmentieri]MBI0573944.1 hypothetical protein [Pectobacterium parmentieri]
MVNDGVRSLIGRIVLMLVILLSQQSFAFAEGSAEHKSVPIAVTFGVRALTPDVPVNPQVPFVSQMVTLPDVACTTCTAQDNWTRSWSLSPMTLDRSNSRVEQGWYVFSSGLKGIGIGVRTEPNLQQTTQGEGGRLKEDGELTVGLVRLGHNTGAGLVNLPPAEFSRVTTFRDQDGQVKYVQKDTFRVTADFRVPTCTSSTGSLSMRLPDVSRAWLQNNLTPGQHSTELGSIPQLIVANCSENTHVLRIRFIPSGSVADSQAGPTTVLVGRDEDNQDTGIGFLMTYEAEGFGLAQHGVVHWERTRPLVLRNPKPVDNSDELSKGIAVTLQAFYARPANNKPLSAGSITAKGLYQVSYD